MEKENNTKVLLEQNLIYSEIQPKAGIASNHTDMTLMLKQLMLEFVQEITEWMHPCLRFPGREHHQAHSVNIKTAKYMNQKRRKDAIDQILQHNLYAMLTLENSSHQHRICHLHNGSVQVTRRNLWLARYMYIMHLDTAKAKRMLNTI